MAGRGGPNAESVDCRMDRFSSFLAPYPVFSPGFYSEVKEAQVCSMASSLPSNDVRRLSSRVASGECCKQPTRASALDLSNFFARVSARVGQSAAVNERIEPNSSSSSLCDERLRSKVRSRKESRFEQATTEDGVLCVLKRLYVGR